MLYCTTETIKSQTQMSLTERNHVTVMRTEEKVIIRFFSLTRLLRSCFLEEVYFASVLNDF